MTPLLEKLRVNWCEFMLFEKAKASQWRLKIRLFAT
jgi:hypothetical protein